MIRIFKDGRNEEFLQLLCCFCEAEAEAEDIVMMDMDTTS